MNLELQPFCLDIIISGSSFLCTTKSCYTYAFILKGIGSFLPLCACIVWIRKLLHYVQWLKNQLSMKALLLCLFSSRFIDNDQALHGPRLCEFLLERK